MQSRLTIRASWSLQSALEERGQPQLAATEAAKREGHRERTIGKTNGTLGQDPAKRPGRDGSSAPPSVLNMSQAEPMRRWAPEQAIHIACQGPLTSRCDGRQQRGMISACPDPRSCPSDGRKTPFRQRDVPLGLLLHGGKLLRAETTLCLLTATASTSDK